MVGTPSGAALRAAEDTQGVSGGGPGEGCLPMYPFRQQHPQPVGMADLETDKTGTYVLSMTYDTLRGHLRDLLRGEFGLAVRNVHGKWVNAVDANFGGTKRFVVGRWEPSYKLGTYGVDPFTRTAWAVINHAGDLAVAEDPESNWHHHQPWHDEEGE